MAETDSGHTATDIITYIGVPLAVLGVLPIIFNTVVTLTALSKIKRMLRHSKLTALTRSDVVNRVIEVELPRYAVTPWDRFNQKAEYWQLSRQPSLIPGGSWTTLNWKIHTIGNKTQRLVYADQLRQPQVEVTFEELVAYLLDLGAIPDAHGWRLLRSTGLWAPVGCPLMSSPGGHKALSIAPLDDSDGHLSLAVNWSSSWTTRDFLSVPPFWVRLPPPLVKKFEEAENGEASSSHEAPKLELQDAMENIKKDHESMGKQSIDSTSKQAQFNAMTEITCQISVDGLITALSHESEISNTATNLHSLYIEHLRIRRGPSHGVWFASAATAYGTTSQTVLWNYTIPDEVLNFSQKNSLPCGVLVLLGVVEEQETPEWATRHDVSGETHELFVRRMAEQRLAVQAESRMPPAQRELAVKDRMQKEMQQRLQDMRDKSRLDTQRREMRTLEALQSPKWSTKLVAERNLAWLKAKGYVDESMALKDVVGTLLHRMVLDGQFSSTLCTMLELWKAFYENGGMRKSDFDALRDDQETFAYASLLLALINETTMTQQGTLAMDLQECLRMWKTVRLG